MLRFMLTVLLLTAGSTIAQGFSLPAAGPGLRVVVLGDFNGSYGTVGYGQVLRSLLARLPDWQPDLVLMPGDLIAGQDSSLPDERFTAMWAGFDLEVASVLRAAGIPFAAAMGNHDASSLRSGGSFTYGRERAAAERYWRSRPPALEFSEAETAAGFPFNWSFSTGDLFVIVWDASSAMVTAEQEEWLLAQLAGPEAQAARWRWLVGHLPLVGVAERRDRAGEVLAGGAELAARLAAAGLDTYVSGHQGAWYPGELNGLQLLMSGGIGGRRLISGDAPVRSTVTVVDLHAGDAVWTTFDAVTGERVDPAELPELINGFGGTVRLSARALNRRLADTQR